MDNIDRYIKNIVSNNISEHTNYKHTIKNALTTKKIKTYAHNNLLKKIAVIIISITTIGGVAFAKQFSETLSNCFKNKIESNSDNYTQILDDNTKTVDDLTIKIDSVLVDDYKIQLGITYLYKEAITSAESKITIKDENNNLLFENSEFDIADSYNVFTKKDKTKYSSLIINHNEISENIRLEDEMEQVQYARYYESSYQNIQDNNLKRMIELKSDLDNKFPVTKKIHIQFEDIILKNGSKIIKKINKSINFEIELDEKFMKREISIYQESNNESEFKLINSQLSNVQLKVRLEYTGEQDLKDLMNTANIIQIYDNKNNKYISTSMKLIYNNTIDLSFNVDRNILSNELTIIMGNIGKISILKSKI